jgi:O-acetylserine/cysteine efflux transporter
MALRDFALMVLVCLIWSSNNIVSKFVVSHMGVEPLFYAALRFAIVAVAVCRWLLPAPRPLWRLVVVALLMGGGNFALMFVGLKTSSPSSVAIVSQLGVPMTAVMSWFMLGERLDRRRAFGVALTLAGVLLVMWDPRGLHASFGLLYVVAATVLGSLGAVMMKQMPGVKPLQFQAWVGFASMFPLFVLSFWLEPGAWRGAVNAGQPFVAAVLFSALIVSVSAHTAYYGLIQRYEATLVSPLTLMTPLGTIALGVMITHDSFGPRMAIGSAIALAGVLVIALRPNQILSLLLALRPRSQ